MVNKTCLKPRPCIMSPTISPCISCNSVNKVIISLISYIFWLQSIECISSGTIRLTANITKYFLIIWVRSDKWYSLDRMHMLHFLKKNKYISKTYKNTTKSTEMEGAPRDLIVSFPSAVQPFLCSVLSSYFWLEWINKNINK